MIHNTSIVFEEHPNVDTLAQAFVGGRYFSEEALAYHFSHLSGVNLLVATIRGRIVGAIMYHLIPDSMDSKILKLHFVEVLPDFQNNRIGTCMLEKVEELYRLQISQISGSTTGPNISSQKMFLNAGFQAIDNNRYIKDPRI